MSVEPIQSQVHYEGEHRIANFCEEYIAPINIFFNKFSHNPKPNKITYLVIDHEYYAKVEKVAKIQNYESTSITVLRYISYATVIFPLIVYFFKNYNRTHIKNNVTNIKEKSALTKLFSTSKKIELLVATLPQISEKKCLYECLNACKTKELRDLIFEGIVDNPIEEDSTTWKELIGQYFMHMGESESDLAYAKLTLFHILNLEEKQNPMERFKIVFNSSKNTKVRKVIITFFRDNIHDRELLSDLFQNCLETANDDVKKHIGRAVIWTARTNRIYLRKELKDVITDKVLYSHEIRKRAVHYLVKSVPRREDLKGTVIEPLQNCFSHPIDTDLAKVILEKAEKKSNSSKAFLLFLQGCFEKTTNVDLAKAILKRAQKHSNIPQDFSDFLEACSQHLNSKVREDLTPTMPQIQEMITTMQTLLPYLPISPEVLQAGLFDRALVFFKTANTQEAFLQSAIDLSIEENNPTWQQSISHYFSSKNDPEHRKLILKCVIHADAENSTIIQQLEIFLDSAQSTVKEEIMEFSEKNITDPALRSAFYQQVLERGMLGSFLISFQNTDARDKLLQRAINLSLKENNPTWQQSIGQLFLSTDDPEHRKLILKCVIHADTENSTIIEQLQRFLDSAQNTVKEEIMEFSKNNITDPALLSDFLQQTKKKE